MGMAKACIFSYSQQQIRDLLSHKFLVGLQVNARNHPWADPLFEHTHAFGLHNVLQQPVSWVHEARYICVCFKCI